MTHSQRREIARTLMPLALLVLLMQAVAPWQSLSRVAMGGAGIGDGICLAGGAEASPTDDGRAPLRHDHAAACCLPSQRQADAGAPLILWTPAPPPPAAGAERLEWPPSAGSPPTTPPHRLAHAVRGPPEAA